MILFYHFLEVIPLVREVSKRFSVSPGLGGQCSLLGKEGTLGAGNSWVGRALCLWLASLRECASGARDSLEN